MCQYQRAKCNKIGKGLNDDEGQAILLDKHNELRRRIVIPAYLTLFDMGGGSHNVSVSEQRAKCNKIGKRLNDYERQAILLDKHIELSRRIPT